jgi:hypothetical protein
MELENIILSEVNQFQKAKSLLFSLKEYRPTNTAVLNCRTGRWNKSYPLVKAGISGRGEVMAKGGKRRNTVQKNM